MTDKLAAALQEIARGKGNGRGQPYSGADARDIARRALVEADMTWPKQGEDDE